MKTFDDLTVENRRVLMLLASQAAHATIMANTKGQIEPPVIAVIVTDRWGNDCVVSSFGGDQTSSKHHLIVQTFELALKGVKSMAPDRN